MNQCPHCQPLLATGVTTISNKPARFILDWTSDCSYVTSRFVKHARLHQFKKPHIFSGIGNNTSVATEATILATTLGGRDMNFLASLTDDIARLKPVDVVPHASWPWLAARRSLMLDTYPRPGVSIDVLIGLDVIPHLVKQTLQKDLLEAIVMRNGALVVHGLIPVTTTSEPQCDHLTLLTSENMSLDEYQSRLLSLEAIGIEPPTPQESTTREQIALEKIENTLQYDDITRSYECGILWDEPRPQFKGTMARAIARLKGIEKRFLRDPEFAAFYRKSMGGYFERNDVKYLSDSEIGPDVDVYYCPHSAVWKNPEEEPRVVWEANSSDVNGNSANDAIIVSPNNTSLLLAIILRFRLHCYAVTSDISKMYMSLRLREDDQKYARFVWREDQSQPIGHYAFLKTPWGYRDSSFKCQHVLRRHSALYAESDPTPSRWACEAFYVDDCLLSGPETEVTPENLDRLRHIVAEAGYDLTKWVSNHPQVLASIPPEKRKPADAGPLSALGITWDPDQDLFLFTQASAVQKTASFLTKVTRRHISSYAGQIFDPLGLCLPAVFQGKLLVQESWAHEGHWDTPVPDALRKKFMAWVDTLQNLNRFRMPRCIRDPGKTVVRSELITFTDASPAAVCAAVYYHCTYSDGQHSCRLLMAKTKVAPTVRKTDSAGVKTKEVLSLPRLELLSALIGVRLAATCAEYLREPSIPKVYLGDSSIALYWIYSAESKNLREWVQRRVSEIRTLAEPTSFYHIPGIFNPADLATRFEICQRLTDLDVRNWCYGPSHWPEWQSFLQGDRTPFADQFPLNDIQSTHAAQIKEEEPARATTLAISGVIKPWWLPLRRQLQKLVSACGNFDKLLRVTAYFLRVFMKSVDKPRGRFIRISELRKARQLLFELAQWDHKADWELWQRKHHCFYSRESRLMRLKGRFDKADHLPIEMRHQICLPAKHVVTRLFIRSTHRNHGCASPERTLTYVRLLAWIMPSAGLRCVKSMLHKAPCCVRHTAKECQAEMGDLPNERLLAELSFMYVGIDTAGPLPIRRQASRKLSPQQIDLGDYLQVSKKQSTKAGLEEGNLDTCHFLIVTCMSSRAIHLVAVRDLSTTSLFHALSKAFNCRGWPKKIFSDNHKTFKALSESQPIGSRADWSFIADRAPWWGGFYERLIGLTKETLRKILWSPLVTFEEMEYLLSECMAFINDRPLAKNLSDPEESSRVTPALLVQNRPVRLPMTEQDPGSTPDQITSTADANIRLKQHASLRKQFWNRWRSQYLLQLQQYSRQWDTSSPTRLKEGDVVLVMEKPKSRNWWKLGRVVSVQESRKKPHDAMPQIRSAMVQTTSGLIRRPTRLLAPLEVDINPHTGQPDNVA